MPNSPRSAAVITVLNMKGGVGKTHCSWLFVAGCLDQGRRMLAVDTDTQANLTSSLLGTTDPEPPTLERLLDPTSDATPIDLVRTTRFEGIDVIPSSKSRLLPFDLSDQVQWERSDLHLSYVDVIEELRSQYDYIVIDCPPRLSLVSFAALCASDFVLIPLEAADWGAQGIADVRDIRRAPIRLGVIRSVIETVIRMSVSTSQRTLSLRATSSSEPSTGRWRI